MSEQSQRWRSEATKAKGQYDAMGGFSGSGYTSRLGGMLDGACDEIAALEAKLEETEQDAAAWRQSWRDAKDQAVELANAILEAPYKPYQGGLAEFNRWTKLAHGIVGNLAAAQEEKE